MTKEFFKTPPMENCPACGGSGITSFYPDGSLRECELCGATGMVEARDEKGRFLPWDTIYIKTVGSDIKE